MIASHLDTSKFNRETFDYLNATSFSTNAMNPYLFGDIYSNQPIQLGRSFLFLKNPENIINGKITKGIKAEADFASNITLPINKPNEAPQNDIKKNTKQ